MHGLYTLLMCSLAVINTFLYFWCLIQYDPHCLKNFFICYGILQNSQDHKTSLDSLYDYAVFSKICEKQELLMFADTIHIYLQLFMLGEY